ncbi:NAD(P)H-dependent oxidoreductase [Weissella coleopterorum]|uniref:NAD(P)H-dependent oxidoreductase n=1 Tax=Weissella coleopterorum TaxID=2714949 RepID=A0A6G8AZT5_9LACO|nr:NADPH-dependent FMN reductase [Weissella coleopterorum]QIL50479.1 NAD(P)H-dependent oxidoreductase [Weissella coleopterorum]
MTKYGVLIGSLRENSFTAGVAHSLVKGLPADAEVTYLEIANLPFYNQDFDADSPASYKAFRELVAAQDAFIIATPEYNRSIPAVLKNALDIASRPWGESVWDGKPVLPASQSTSGMGGMLANHTLRQTLEFLNMKIMTQPELYIGNTPNLSDDQGNITNEDTNKFLAGVVKQFDAFVKNH